MEGWIQAVLDGGDGGCRGSADFSDSPMRDDELGGVVGMVVRGTRSETGCLASHLSLIPTDILLSSWPPLRELALPRSPYRGLDVYRESDARVFHGRERESVELAGLVRANPVATLVGSGFSGAVDIIEAVFRREFRAAVHAARRTKRIGAALPGGFRLLRATPDRMSSDRGKRVLVLEAQAVLGGAARSFRGATVVAL